MLTYSDKWGHELIFTRVRFDMWSHLVITDLMSLFKKVEFIGTHFNAVSSQFLLSLSLSRRIVAACISFNNISSIIYLYITLGHQLPGKSIWNSLVYTS